MYMDGWIRMYAYVCMYTYICRQPLNTHTHTHTHTPTHTHTHTHTQPASTPGNEKALFQAAEKGDTTTVVALLEAGTNANCRNEVCVYVCVCACNPKL